MENKKIIDGRWEFVKNEHHYKVLLRNIYNNQEVELNYNQYKEIAEGKTYNTVSKIMARRLKKENKGRFKF